MSKYDKYKESAFTHEEMQPMIMEMGKEVATNPFRQTTTMPKFSDKHPQDVLKWIMEESAALEEGNE